MSEWWQAVSVNYCEVGKGGLSQARLNTVTQTWMGVVCSVIVAGRVCFVYA